ncbi:MAG: restriction endonuclease subunit S [Clostridia bacterium]|jgi:type I restriction enzyme S subunit|nr:restriction endonuclease subunit S [Clostridia bacterium]MCI2013632.1 restriction endonuclease subunit S [Clostridia bacterium]
MTEEIKARIEQIKAGKVPEGYIKTRAGLMPSDWNINKKAKEVFRRHTDKKHDDSLEILAATQENGIVPRSQINIDIKCSEEGINGYKKVDAGDFVISLRSFQGGIEYSPYDGIVSPAYTVLKPAIPISNEYYKNYFKTEEFISRLNSTIYGIRDGKQIGYDDFGDLIIHNPPLSEQQNIADILLQCDKVIALKKERIKEEKKLKKWLMQKLLNPNSGVRLPGYEKSEWEKTNIGCVTISFSGGTPESSKKEYYCENGIPFIRSGEISSTKTELFLTQKGYQNSSAKMVNKGDLLYALYGANSGDCFISQIHGAINQAILCIRSTKVNIVFLYYVLKNAQNHIVSTYLQGGQGNLSAAIIKKISAFIPIQNEQIAICKVLSTQDEKIHRLEQELAQWQQKKKALMQLLLTGIARVPI